ncbi:hypothetical protein CROQUDRAFT_672136 [Cronartium quercuum f. sp. fusiforme G11]|uniref:Ubiquinone biosynthesis O-methyltransferase, mitochondrial n=1 Tax=Cronartium quercuum f. sp. fusiforme G11 TaxID=708437 RepID=A0A9P6NDM7_9BASI|nr:hypothetical protein CROQUDRAFT_672136 [Cronartium quercuum f. sp. fusiforme G11]
MRPVFRALPRCLFQLPASQSHTARRTAAIVHQLHSTAPADDADAPARLPSSASFRPAPTPTVSSEEIEHFNGLGSTWWDESGGFGLLHRMNPVRTQFIRERILWDVTPNAPAPKITLPGHRFLTGKSVLDVGCGGGIFSEVLARLGGDVLGIDAAAGSIQAASAHASLDPKLNFQSMSEEAEEDAQDRVLPPSRLRYRHCSVEDLLKEGHHHERYDLVCAMEVIEHVEDPHAFLTGLAQLTKPGGHVALSTISRTPLARFLTITLAESGLPLIGMVPPGTHTYDKFIKPEQLTEFFRSELGWARSLERSELETRGSFYEPFTGNWVLFPREAKWGEWVSYFFGVKKPL